MSVMAATNWLRPFGTTGITVSAICMGGAQLGSMPELFGYEVTEDAAIDLVRQVMDRPIRFLDTSNGYGGGRSEERIGRAVAQHGGLPADFVISTKVDALDGDYSGARVRDLGPGEHGAARHRPAADRVPPRPGVPLVRR